MVADADATHHEYDSRDVNSRIWLLASLFARVGATPPQTLSDYFTTRNSVRSIRLAPSLFPSFFFPYAAVEGRERQKQREKEGDRSSRISFWFYTIPCRCTLNSVVAYALPREI